MDILLALGLIIIILIITYFLGIFRGAPFLPTYAPTVKRMIELVELKPGEKLADLGSGDGRLLIAAAHAGAEAHGFEINPLLVWWSRIKIKRAGLSDRAFVHTKNFWGQDFSEFNVITVFGISSIMPQLEIKLQKELKPGARVVSNIFAFPNWAGEKEGPIRIYRA